MESSSDLGLWYTLATKLFDHMPTRMFLNVSQEIRHFVLQSNNNIQRFYSYSKEAYKNNDSTPKSEKKE